MSPSSLRVFSPFLSSSLGLLLVLSSVAVACSSGSDEQTDESGPGGGGSAAGTGGASGMPGGHGGGTAGEAAAGTGGSGMPGGHGGEEVCPAGGIFGACTENPGCQCLRGATVYQFCTISCESPEECGTADDFPGAIPGCYPVNQGDPNKICALICKSNEDCPCGLVCTPSGLASIKLCAEMQ